MSIVLARIDNRLIHGQVLESWVPFSQAECIVVANDAIAAQPLQRTLLTAAVPSSLQVVFGTVQEIAARLVAGELHGRRLLLLFATPEDALTGVRAGIPLAELNLGNLHGGAGKERFSCTIALDQGNIDTLTELEGRGVHIVARCIPSDDPREWRKLLPGGGR